ncbi:hypothetical protein N0V82_006057 [Gnomoniopsis sp. IMI 355080]|nr:hypothetical protein N0V82_006057 [Gnomoniopsis sp. IMI 355080]
MGYRDYFMPKVKWAKVPFKDLNDSHEGEEGGDGDSESSSTLLGEKSNEQSTFRRNAGRLVWLLHIALLAVNITWWLNWNTSAHPADSHSPLPQKNIEYEWSDFNVSLVMDDPFIQPWNDVSNKAWMDLTEGGNMGSVVSNEWMKKAGYESVEMGDGEGQWVFLEIYHDLHCLSYLRKVIYNSTNGLITDDSDPFFKYHVPHCLNNLRLKLMCHADLGVMTQRWVDGFYEPWLVYHSENHQCKNWDKIKDWAIEHAATKDIPKHPHEAQRKNDALNEPWFDPYHIKYIDGLCGNGYC